VSSGTAFTPAAGDQVCGNVNQQLWISWDGAAWSKRSVVSFDPGTNTPTFGATSAAFDFPVGPQLYLNDQGVNYLVSTADGAAYDVRIERQTVARPDNAAAFAPQGALFRRSWGDPDTRYALDVDPSSATFLKLVVDTVGTQDAQAGVHAGDLVTSGQWGLVEEIGGVLQSDQFNWEYPTRPGDQMGTQQFLIAQGAEIFLDDPIRLSPVSLTSFGGLTKQYALQFDGNWVGGLPNVWNLLQASGFQMTPGIAAQVVSIPDHTLVTDGTKDYVFLATELQEFLPVLEGATSLPLDGARAVDLALTPVYDPSWANTAAQPTVALKYSLGTKIQ
jgi:hypothetical protein